MGVKNGSEINALSTSQAPPKSADQSTEIERTVRLTSERVNELLLIRPEALGPKAVPRTWVRLATYPQWALPRGPMLPGGSVEEVRSVCRIDERRAGGRPRRRRQGGRLDMAWSKNVEDLLASVDQVIGNDPAMTAPP